MPSPPIEIELIDPPDRAFVGQPAAIGLVVRRPTDCTGPVVLQQIGCRDGSLAVLDADLFERDVAVGPGEAYRCTVRATFARPGVHAADQFFVQAGAGPLVPLPAHPVQVVESLARQIHIRVGRVCGYDLGTKVEVELTHGGTTTFTDFRVAAGPAGRVRAGLAEHYRTAFAPGDRLRFDAVVAGTNLELTLDGSAAGESVGPVVADFPIPAGGTESKAVPFRFFEARRLATDRVRVWSADDGREVPLAGGLYPVRGGGSRYRVLIRPSHPQATAVALGDEPGRVEVTEPRRLDDGGWEFPVYVVSNPFFTDPVRLYYDVTTPGRVFRGEIHLSVRPTWQKHLGFAATFGVAVTIKGLVSVGQTVSDPSGVWGDVPEWLDKVKLLDLAYLSSIPLTWLVLHVADRVYRRVRHA